MLSSWLGDPLVTWLECHIIKFGVYLVQLSKCLILKISHFGKIEGLDNYSKLFLKHFQSLEQFL